MQHVPRTTISRKMLLAAILIWTTDAAFAQTAAELQRAKAKCDEYLVGLAAEVQRDGINPLAVLARTSAPGMSDMEWALCRTHISALMSSAIAEDQRRKAAELRAWIEERAAQPNTRKLERQERARKLEAERQRHNAEMDEYWAKKERERQAKLAEQKRRQDAIQAEIQRSRELKRQRRAERDAELARQRAASGS